MVGQHTWLEYSQSIDAAFCFACRHFFVAQLAKVSDASFTPVGYSNWKREKKSQHCFNVHINSDCHKATMIAWTNYKRMESASTSISRMVSEAQQRTIEESRQYIKTLGEILLLTAKQDIAQRGHKENEESISRGNFLEILNSVKNHDQATEKKGQKYQKIPSTLVLKSKMKFFKFLQTSYVKKKKKCRRGERE